MSRFESAVGQIVLLTATPSVQTRSRISFSAKDIPLRYNQTRYEMLITNNRILLPDRCPIHFDTCAGPVKLSPQYYTVLIDNDEVRVLEFRFKPGEKEPMHSHPRGFVYSLADAKIKVSFPDGKSEESVLKNGEARWRDAVTHAAENIGTTEAHVIAVELKKPAK